MEEKTPIDNNMLELALKTKELDINDQVKVAANLLGYKKMPPDIRTFIHDPYYLGNILENLYPFWEEELVDIYPNPISTRYPILVFRGGIGTGKSTAARICAAYQLTRLLHLKNPHKTFGMVPGKFIDFNFFSYTSGLAQSEFISVLGNWFDKSPYFQDVRKEDGMKGITFTPDGPRGNSAISKDIIFYNLSEINFIPYNKAFQKLDNALKRWDSRFSMFKHYFGHIIIDTSSKGDDSIADAFVESNPYQDVKVISTNQWKVRAHLNYYGRKGWFKCFIGDSMHSPFIVSEDKVITPDMDPDRVIEVPEELRPDFEFNIISALQDKAGISTNSSDRFFPDPTNLMKCFTLPTHNKEVIKLDFYDKTDKLIYHLDSLIRTIPDDRIIYIRYDIGVVRDYTGLAIGYFDGWKTYDRDRKMRQPIIKVPIAVAISRFEGDETPIFHLEEFILELKERFEIGMVTCDQFASRQLLQNLKREGINSSYLSVDRTDTAYVYTKTLANNGLLYMPDNYILKKEMADLRRVGTKIDHSATGSKDIADAVSGMIFSLYQDIDHAGQISNKQKVNTYSNFMRERAQSPVDNFQEMVNNLF